MKSSPQVCHGSIQDPFKLPVVNRHLRQSKVNALRERWLSSPECSLRGVSKPQSASREELSALMPSILDKAFKGELYGVIKMISDAFEYDVALSFAGEDRGIVEEFAQLLRVKNIKYFYDETESYGLWGKDLIAHLADIYGKKARFCVIFLSQYYPLKKWTKIDRMIVQERAFRDPNEYILPLRLDDTELPGLVETTGYRDIRQQSLESIVNALGKKLATEDLLASAKTARASVYVSRGNSFFYSSAPIEQSANIFISYARTDTNSVQRIYKALLHSKYYPWMDIHSIKGGENWLRAIYKAIDECQIFLAVLSNNSVSRRGIIQKELKKALDKWEGMLPDDIFILPLRIDDCPIPEILQEIQVIDWKDGKGRKKLLEAIGAALQRRKQS